MYRANELDFLRLKFKTYLSYLKNSRLRPNQSSTSSFAPFRKESKGIATFWLRLCWKLLFNFFILTSFSFGETALLYLLSFFNLFQSFNVDWPGYLTK